MATSEAFLKRSWRVQLIALMLLALACGRVSAQTQNDVYVTMQDYTAEHNAGSINGLYCASTTNPNPYPVCEQHYWVAYSVGLNPPMSQALCGQCLQVHNW
jgi:hypothetical protein